MIMQIFLTALCAFSGHLYLAILHLPLMLTHIKMLMTKEYKFHCMTHKDYEIGGRKKKNEALLKWKSIFHVAMTFIMLGQFIWNLYFAASYHISKLL